MMATTTVPSGYRECDGSAVSRTTFSALFTAIGTTWGSGDGSTTFNLPDLRGEFVRGWASDRRGDGVDPSSDTGRSFASSQDDGIRQHTHNYNGGNLKELQGDNAGNDDYANSGGTTSANTANASGDNETRPRNIAMMYVIKT